MNTAKASYPPLTTNDIIILKGAPTVKMIENLSLSNAKKEEWVYYNIDTASEEHYFFRKEQLINWEKGSENINKEDYLER